jgi:hypothetical protein
MATLTSRTLAQATAITPTTLIHIVTTGDTSQSSSGSSFKAELSQLFWSGNTISNFYVNNLIVNNPYIPTGSTDPTGVVGTISWSGNTIYLKNSTQWVRLTGQTF